ncbi:MAG TPA: 4Fe-4S binding protein [archaeon]|nr:4Fe-4S binding protein [archaeon]
MEKPNIDYKKCTECGTCINICPVGVFAKEGKKTVVKNASECIQCRACEASCPQKAIIVK